MPFPTLNKILIKIQARGKKPEYFVLFSDTKSHPTTPKNDNINHRRPVYFVYPGNAGVTADTQLP